jgi:penicillin-binding protein 1B
VETIEEQTAVLAPPSWRDKLSAFFSARAVQRFIIVASACVLIAISVGMFYYMRSARLIDAKLRVGPFTQSVNVYAAPMKLRVGDSVTSDTIVTQLHKGGYTTAARNGIGHYAINNGTLEIYPGPDSYFGPEPAVLHFSGGRLQRIVSLSDNTARTEYQIEPQLLINLTDQNREKRRIVHYADVPRSLVEAVVAVEDKHFFQHSGLDLPRLIKAAWVDLREGRKEQGGSTLSMQLARNLWLDPDKNFRRKSVEILMAMHMEHKLSKQQIFEIYCNQVYLGRQGTFSIHGFGEAARDLFGKDLGQLTLAESALLAGMIQRPSFYNPSRNSERARERRDLVLTLMREQGYITEGERARAAAEQIHLSANGDNEALEAQYFIDLVNNEVQNRLESVEGSSERVYTTLDMELQHAAEDAVRVGMREVDKQIASRRKKGQAPAGEPQVALVALDPHTGQIKALVGGRSYGQSQLNHVLAQRQPGSSFKPFVYAAALDTAVEGGQTILTAASTVDDQPTTFRYDRQEYTPGNFHQQFLGRVTLRTALAHSLNIPAVKVGQMVGFDAVVQMARRAGLPATTKPTPAVALGAYEATPLDIAGAYTVFANQGVYVHPILVDSVRGRDGRVTHSDAQTRRALDIRVAYLMVNLLQEVMRSGTAAGVRGRGFVVPAAGKTGTSRDGWFAGFTTQLLCVVWVGYDDNRDLGLEGAHSALPIWTEFMKRAVRMPDYSNAKQFPMPDGIVGAQICTLSGQLATPYCDDTRRELFIDATQPEVECQIHTGTPATVVVSDQQRPPSQGSADRHLVPMPSNPGQPSQPPN